MKRGRPRRGGNFKFDQVDSSRNAYWDETEYSSGAWGGLLSGGSTSETDPGGLVLTFTNESNDNSETGFGKMISNLSTSSPGAVTSEFEGFKLIGRTPRKGTHHMAQLIIFLYLTMKF